MEGFGNGGSPDLETVLKTLAALAPTPQNRHPHNHILQSGQEGQVQSSIISSHDGPSTNKRLSVLESPVPQSSRSDRTREMNKDKSTPTPGLDLNIQPSSSSVIDPATIIDWPKGLRCVSKIAAQNPKFKETFQQMIADQDKHEILWYEGRQAIADKRADTEADQEKLAKELHDYNLKVYNASKDMTETMSATFCRMGVPFFGTRAEFISKDDDRASIDQADASAQSDLVQKISQKELLKLQRQMIQYLEDMYKL